MSDNAIGYAVRVENGNVRPDLDAVRIDDDAFDRSLVLKMPIAFNIYSSSSGIDRAPAASGSTGVVRIVPTSGGPRSTISKFPSELCGIAGL